MALRQWLLTAKPPKPKTPLLPERQDEIDRSALEEVDKVVQQKVEKGRKRRGSYGTYDDELRAKFAKYGCLRGQRNAARHFSKTLGHTVPQSTVASMMRSYRQGLIKNPALAMADTMPKRQRGRPLLLDTDVDERVQSLLRRLRDEGGVVNVPIALGIAMGVAMKMSPSALQKHGGWLGADSKAFGKSLLKRMNFGKHKGTKTAKKVPDNVEELRLAFATSIRLAMDEQNIPDEMVVNLDETSLPYVPASEWTM